MGDATRFALLTTRAFVAIAARGGALASRGPEQQRFGRSCADSPEGDKCVEPDDGGR